MIGGNYSIFFKDASGAYALNCARSILYYVQNIVTNCGAAVASAADCTAPVSSAANFQYPPPPSNEVYEVVVDSCGGADPSKSPTLDCVNNELNPTPVEQFIVTPSVYIPVAILMLGSLAVCCNALLCVPIILTHKLDNNKSQTKSLIDNDVAEIKAKEENQYDVPSVA